MQWTHRAEFLCCCFSWLNMTKFPRNSNFCQVFCSSISWYLSQKVFPHLSFPISIKHPWASTCLSCKVPNSKPAGDFSCDNNDPGAGCAQANLHLGTSAYRVRRLLIQWAKNNSSLLTSSASRKVCNLLQKWCQ